MSNTAGSDYDDDAIEDNTDCTNCIWTRLETVSNVRTLELIILCACIHTPRLMVMHTLSVDCGPETISAR
jgi:hypothetical protein